MQKLMCIAAALLVLVGCNNKEEINGTQNPPAQIVTITGGIDFSSQVGARKVAPQSDWEEVGQGGTINFHWVIGDEVSVIDPQPKGDKQHPVYEYKKFTVTAIDDKGIATLTGEALSSGMARYVVLYPYVEITGEVESATLESLLKQTYKKDSFEPFISGLGQENKFTLNQFCPAIHLQLKGDVVLGKIEYSLVHSNAQTDDHVSAQMTFEGGLKLDNTTSTDVVLFVNNNTKPSVYPQFELSFYDTSGQLVMKKRTANTLVSNSVTTFPELTVTASTPTVDPKDVFDEGATINFTFEYKTHRQTSYYEFNYTNNGSGFTCDKIIEDGEDMTSTYASLCPVTLTGDYTFKFQFAEVNLYYDGANKTYKWSIYDQLTITDFKVNDVSVFDQLTDITEK